MHSSALSPAWSKPHLAVNEELEERDWLLGAVLVHARHVEVVQEDHEALAHRGSIGVLGALLCTILSGTHTLTFVPSDIFSCTKTL